MLMDSVRVNGIGLSGGYVDGFSGSQWSEKTKMAKSTLM